MLCLGVIHASDLSLCSNLNDPLKMYLSYEVERERERDGGGVRKKLERGGRVGEKLEKEEWD